MDGQNREDGITEQEKLETLSNILSQKLTEEFSPEASGRKTVAHGVSHGSGVSAFGRGYRYTERDGRR
jgi:hypothetical protein